MRFWWTLLMALTLSAFGGAAPTITRPGKSPLVTLRLVFRTGSAQDPKGKEGLAALTAAMIGQGGTRHRSYQQIVDAMFPMATAVEMQVDKEMTTFGSETHVDNLDAFYALFREMLVEPGWRQEDLTRIRDQAINYLRVSLRGNNDEELGKEVLYNTIYDGHPYGHHNLGTVSSLQSITLADIKSFYAKHYTRANLTIAIAGGYPAGFPDRVEKDFDKLPKADATALPIAKPKPIRGRHLLIVDKPTRSVAMSLGFPIPVRRGDPDYPALLVAASWLGQHRNSGVRLFERIREVRGLNYGDYAYIEYFPRGMYQFEPDPNLARQQQIFQVWIRPVTPETAHFTLRLAFFELERFHKEGLGEEDFERTRNFLSKYVNLLTRTKRAELGYAIDSIYYGIPEYSSYLKTELAKLTREDVNKAIRTHLSPANMQVVLVADGATALRDRIVAETPSPMKYNSAKPEAVLEEDKIVEKLKLGIPRENTRIIPVDRLFE